MPENVVILGGGIAGLTTAYALAKRGILARIIEARHHLGGLVASGHVGGIQLDLGAESFALRSSVICELCDELGLPYRTPAGQSWVWNDGIATPIAHGLWGIPSSWDDHAFQVLTDDELEIAHRDRALGPRVGSDSTTLAELVRVRLGQAVLEKMVEPVAGGVHTASPDDLDLDTVCPGLRDAIQREGSLISAVHSIRGNSAPVLAQPVGGMSQLVRALIERLKRFGTQIDTGLIVTDIAREGSEFEILVAESDGNRSNPKPVPGTEEILNADRVIMALSGSSALPLLNKFPEINFEWEAPQGAAITTASLILNNSLLDEAPRGSGLLVKPGSAMRAKALTHYSIKWPWAYETLSKIHGPSTHVVRVSYGRPDEPVQIPSPSDVLSDASRLLSIELSRTDLLDCRIIHWGPSLSPHSPEHRNHLESLKREIALIPGLDVTGAWIAGTGLGAVIPHAYEIGENLE
ncbi:protoporphyrinogen/coproporphyrinogen oxidase [Arcanobacterium ihumii]|uniref:protoporphyrinogen/coproporphyrinogen oxidase n=1 Tax=Arcanobacterium ihumii TaxID=2138162 RepID=UPI000F5380CF|nr:FAD-dependent oxidoreductase [Arcanobacterium ihumii]